MAVRKAQAGLHGYDADFAAWSAEQAGLLRARRWSELDVENLAEEIASLGKSDRRAVRSFLLVVLVHLLKWQYQPERRSRSWRASIRNGRNELELLLADSPSLRRDLGAFLAEEYRKARLAVAEETDLPLAVFPEACPYTVEDVLNSEFLPL